MDPPLCANGCGFFGPATNSNLCSKCYQDFLKQNITKSCEGLKIEINNAGFVYGSSSICHKPRDGATVAVTASNSEIVKKNKNRCKSCNKKIGLTGFKCRCGDVFCGRHRYPEKHACKVDYKDIGRKALAKQNPICDGDKLEYRV